MSIYQQKIVSKIRVTSHSTEQRRIYITNPFENKGIFLNEDLRNVLVLRVVFLNAVVGDFASSTLQN